MVPPILRPLLLLFVGLGNSLLCAPAGGGSLVRFPGLPEHAEAEEVKARLHCVETPGPLNPAQDAFWVEVPAAYRPDGTWGVFVWISPSDSPQVPKEWLRVLEQRRLLFVGASKAGNSRNILDRIRLAVCANLGMRNKFRVDEKRMYASGFSGGGRVASMLGVAYADLFRGSIPFMGVNFYTDLPSADGKKLYAPQYIPHPVVLDLAKRGTRHVLVTSDKDFNRADVQVVFQKGYRKEGFQSVEYLEVPGIGHTLPGAEWLEKALRGLDGERL
ncbi:MAG: hypothetical protein RLZZ142_665 [Verrucomicrobiota bacterium]|jgi:hypothetical protein